MDWHSTVRFPGESAGYRAARDELLAAERNLRQQIERVAELRRKLPLGGAVAEDYVFEDGAGGLVKLSDLFSEGKDTLAPYSFMYGPAMKQACPMCTSFPDSLNGTAPHAAQRLNLAVVAKSPIERIREFARGRGWHHPRLLSSAGNTYNRLSWRDRRRRPTAGAWRIRAAGRQDLSLIRNCCLRRRSRDRTSGIST